MSGERASAEASRQALRLGLVWEKISRVVNAMLNDETQFPIYEQASARRAGLHLGDGDC